MSSVPRLLERKEEVLQLYYSGMSPTDIAKHLNVNFQPIYNLLKYLKIDYKRSYSRKNAKYILNESFFDIIDTEEKAYILGFIIADGFVDELRNRVVISLNVKDIDILYKINSSVGSTALVKEFVKDGQYNHCKLSLNSKKLVSKLVSINVRQGKSLAMDDSIINIIPLDLIRHFLRGYFDGDGCIKYGAKYSSGTKYVAEVVGTEKFLLGTFGKYCKTNNSLYKYKTCNMFAWRCTKKELVDEFLDYIYKDSTIYLERKYDKFRKRPCKTS